MNEYERHLIQCIAGNNLWAAKQDAIRILEKNKAKSNQDFCDRMLERLRDESNYRLPPNVEGLVVVENPKETFNENRYYLSDREKEITDKILKMNGVAEKLASIGVNYVNATLLYGESGTGKTTFGRYIAYRLGLPFVYLNFSNLIDSHLGGTSKNLSNVFNLVKTWKCVLMLDEVDAIGVKRGDSKEVGELSRIVVGLMQNLDSLTNDTVLLGATNRIEIIDDALLRRFTIKHEITRLSEEERTSMAHKYFSDIGLSFEAEGFSELTEADDTQAGLMNRMIMKLADYYSERE